MSPIMICNRCFLTASTPFTFALEKRRVLFYPQPTASPGVKEADTLSPHCQPQGFYLDSAARAPVCYGDSTSSSALLCDLHLFIQSLYYRYTIDPHVSLAHYATWLKHLLQCNTEYVAECQTKIVNIADQPDTNQPGRADLQSFRAESRPIPVTRVSNM